METVHLIIKGKVQGVFYRASAKDKALELGIRGWVKNIPDGHVEILANGNKQDLEKFIEWCSKGPSKAIVDDVIVSESNEKYEQNFRIIK